MERKRLHSFLIRMAAALVKCHPSRREVMMRYVAKNLEIMAAKIAAEQAAYDEKVSSEQCMCLADLLDCIPNVKLTPIGTALGHDVLKLWHLISPQSTSDETPRDRALMHLIQSGVRQGLIVGETEILPSGFRTLENCADCSRALWVVSDQGAHEGITLTFLCASCVSARLAAITSTEGQS